jgi:hypothetical protein
MTQREAEETSQIPRSTLKNKLKKSHPLRPGEITVLSEEAEGLIAHAAIKLSEFGFPLDRFELKKLVQSYLNSHGLTVVKFSNKLPGDDWFWLFL